MACDDLLKSIMRPVKYKSTWAFEDLERIRLTTSKSRTLLVGRDHRYYRAVLDLLISAATLQHAMASYINPSVHIGPNASSSTKIASRASKLNIEFYHMDVLGCIAKNKVPRNLKLHISDLLSEEDMTITPDVIGSYLKGQCLSMFNRYYDSIAPDIEGKFGARQQADEKWPTCLNFGRVIRNAISHGGIITINNKNFPGATWRGVVIERSNVGSEIYSMMSAGDFIFLVMDMDALV